MQWYQEDEYENEEEDLMFSPALLARRASESWIIAPPVEVYISLIKFNAISWISFKNEHIRISMLSTNSKHVKQINQSQI